MASFRIFCPVCDVLQIPFETLSAVTEMALCFPGQNQEAVGEVLCKWT